MYYVYTYMYMCIYIYIYIHVHIRRLRDVVQRASPEVRPFLLSPMKSKELVKYTKLSLFTAIQIL